MVLALPKISTNYIFLLPIFVILFTLWINVDFAEGQMCGKTCTAAKAKNMTVTEYREWLSGTSTSKNAAQTYINHFKNINYISIRVSEACLISGTCPTYKELADLYDNSNRYLSGDFVYNNDTKTWKRESPKMTNAFEYYKFTNMPWIVWVNPDDYTWDRTKQIVIESELRYHDRRDVIENQIRIEYEGLNVDDCKTATIGWKNNGSEILLDLLNHFYSNCKEPLEFDPTVEIFMESKIFEDCDRECFYFKEQFKESIKVDQILEMQRWEEKYCSDIDNKITDTSDYDRNKKECDRIKTILGKDVKTDQKCYGIYCKVIDEYKNNNKTYEEQRAERLKQLEEIQECKKYQIWDEVKEEGKYRRLNYDCNDDEERTEYLKIMRTK